MTRYIETFFRHKLLLCAPIALALVVSIWYVAARPTTYQASTTMWFDTQVPERSSIDGGSNGPTPAAQGQSVLQELLGTRDFLVKVGHRGPLADFVVTHHASKRGPTAPLSAALSVVKSGSGGTASGDDRIVASLGNAVGSSVSGPQILRVTLVGPDPVVTSETLRGLVAQYAEEVTAARRSRYEAAVQYYRQRLDSATKSMSSATTDQVTYIRAHPEVALAPNADPQFAALARAVGGAQTDLTAAQKSYDDAGQALTGLGAATTFHVIDPPNRFASPLGHKKAIFAAVGGLFIGFLLSVLALTALTATDTSARRREDFETPDSGLDVVAQIQHLPNVGSSGQTGRHLHETRST